MHTKLLLHSWSLFTHSSKQNVHNIILYLIRNFFFYFNQVFEVLYSTWLNLSNHILTHRVIEQHLNWSHLDRQVAEPGFYLDTYKCLSLWTKNSQGRSLRLFWPHITETFCKVHFVFLPNWNLSHQRKNEKYGFEPQELVQERKSER